MIASDEQRRAYASDGVVLLRGIFTDWVAPLREAVADAMRDPGPLSRDHAAGGGPRFFTDIYMWRRLPAFRRFIERSPAARICGELMGPPACVSTTSICS